MLLQKRVRILGGLQGLYGYPSTLVILNGRGAFVLLLGPRLDDGSLETVNKVYEAK